MSTYKSVVSMLRHGLKMPKVAKKVAKLIKAKQFKCETKKYYRIYFLDRVSLIWFYSDPIRNLKSARTRLKDYKKKYDDCHIIKITESEEIVC